ncbi:hypothetical protein AB0E81_34530 [Streptomyces sp. NPDC033538]|uniref:hypothetical protein n=1 Tax=Streptomyces sp. NPDC033538 TaxID=3155367 RepID=UPI0033C53DDA
MNGTEAAREQLGNDMAVLLVCAIYCLFLAPIVARTVHPVAFRIACWVRARSDMERAGTGTVARGALGKLDAAMAGFRLPFTCRQAVRDRLLEGWVMTAVAVVFIVAPMLIPFGMQTLAQAERAEADRGLAAVFTVTMVFVGAFGGTARYFGPRLEVPAVRSVCSALCTAHQVWQGKATSKELDAAVSGLSGLLIHRAQKDERRWLRVEMTTHAKRVRETLRAGSRELLNSGTPAAAELADKLGKILHGVTATTYETLLAEPDLVPEAVPGEPPKKQTALLLGAGIILSAGLAWGLSALQVPGEVILIVALPVLLLPLYLGGAPGLVRARDLLRLGQGNLEPVPPDNATEVRQPSQEGPPG